MPGITLSLMAEDIMLAWETSVEASTRSCVGSSMTTREFEDDGFTFDDDDDEDEDLDDEDELTTTTTSTTRSSRNSRTSTRTKRSD